MKHFRATVLSRNGAENSLTVRADSLDGAMHAVGGTIVRIEELPETDPIVQVQRALTQVHQLEEAFLRAR